jgi:hypothetical protein
MDMNIYTNQIVASYFNANFINVKVQMNRDKADSPAIIKWYDDASKLNSKYSINAFPSFLFFRPDGLLVHRFSAVVKNPNDFVQKASEALDSKTQNFRMVSEYKAHIKDSAYLSTAIQKALAVWDEASAEKICDNYIKVLKMPYLKENLQIIESATRSSRGRGFRFFMQNRLLVNEILANKSFEDKAYGIVLHEEFDPFMGKATPRPDWQKIYAGAKKKFSEQANKIVLDGKVAYYQSIKDLQNFEMSIKSYMNRYIDSLSSDEINYKAWMVFQLCDSNDILSSAAFWMKHLLVDSLDNNYSAYVDTYANLLYKMGLREDAITWERRAIAQTKNEHYKKEEEETLNKMMQGKMTWGNE